MRNKSQIANPKKNGNCRNGFTLIEMVVAFSILAVLSTIGIAAFVNYSRSQAMQQATNDLSTVEGLRALLGDEGIRDNPRAQATIARALRDLR